MGPCDRSPDHKQRQQQPTANTDPDLGPSMWLSRESNALLSLMSMPYVLGVTPALCAPPKRMKRDDLDSTLKIAMKIMSQMPALYYIYFKKITGDILCDRWFTALWPRMHSFWHLAPGQGSTRWLETPISQFQLNLDYSGDIFQVSQSVSTQNISELAKSGQVSSALLIRGVAGGGGTGMRWGRS